MAVPLSWLKQATIAHNKPKPSNSIIGRLKSNLGGARPGRSRDVLHASDITQSDFCPRREAFLDLQNAKSEPEFLSAALEATFNMGNMTAKLLIEEWGNGYAVGNWVCQVCGEQRSMCTKPAGICFGNNPHLWSFHEPRVFVPKYAVGGSLDVLFDVGTPKLMVTELKIMAPEEFATITAPLPEHRIRTSLYLKLIADSEVPWKEKINLHEARVLVVSRGYGKKNDLWGEILPFREFEVTRDDEAVKPLLQKAMALTQFRRWMVDNPGAPEKAMPSGICQTAMDKVAKKCGHCQKCFSGEFPAMVQIDSM